MFSATHTVGERPLEARSEPDAGLPAAITLEPRLPVAVTEQRGPWSHVTCENGVAGWVDGAQLVAQAPPGASGAPVATPWTTQRKRTVAVVAAIAAIGGYFVLQNDSTSTAAVRPTLTAPAGWATSADGRTVAETATDLGTSTPTGARVSIATGDEDPNAQAMLDAARADTAPLSVREPRMLTIDGVDVMGMTYAKGTRTVGILVADLADGTAVRIVIDAPTDRYEQLRSTLDAIPGFVPA